MKKATVEVTAAKTAAGKLKLKRPGRIYTAKIILSLTPKQKENLIAECNQAEKTLSGYIRECVWDGDTVIRYE